MHLKQLEYFTEAVNCRSINEAAKNLYISQPTISLSIAKLEEEIGVKLLHRTAKGVMPTHMGAKIYQDATRLIQQAENDLQNWQNAILSSHAITGEVKILCMPSASTLISNFVIQELQECSPQIHLHVYEDRVKDDLSSLKDSNMRLVIGSYEISHQNAFYRSIPAGWCVDSLFEDKLAALISPQNPLSKKRALTTADCASLTLAFYCYQDMEYLPAYTTFFKQSANIRLNSREAIMQTIAENIAVAIFPQKITQHDFYQKSNLITSVLFDASAGLSDVMHYIAYGSAPTAAEKQVIDIIHYCAQAYYG